MTLDMLSHVYKNNVDAVYLFSGDGDYQPIIKEIIRQGKTVYIAVFSSGLHPSVKQLADEFIDLDTIFFKPT
jgi:uncharacterized LabA/DUF88 family protein